MRLCATRYLQRGGWRTESIIDGAGSGPRPSSLSTEDDCFRSVGLAGLCVAASSGVRERFRSLIHQARLRQTRSAHYYFVHRAHGRFAIPPQSARHEIAAAATRRLSHFVQACRQGLAVRFGLAGRADQRRLYRPSDPSSRRQSGSMPKRQREQKTLAFQIPRHVCASVSAAC